MFFSRKRWVKFLIRQATRWSGLEEANGVRWVQGNSEICKRKSCREVPCWQQSSLKRERELIECRSLKWEKAPFRVSLRKRHQKWFTLTFQKTTRKCSQRDEIQIWTHRMIKFKREWEAWMIILWLTNDAHPTNSMTNQAEIRQIIRKCKVLVDCQRKKSKPCSREEMRDWQRTQSVCLTKWAKISNGCKHLSIFLLTATKTRQSCSWKVRRRQL